MNRALGGPCKRDEVWPLGECLQAPRVRPSALFGLLSAPASTARSRGSREGPPIARPVR